MKAIIIIFYLLTICIVPSSRAQSPKSAPMFTRADSLRGTLTPERSWWDLLYYDIHVTPDYEHQTINGTNAINFKVTKAAQIMQLDLQEPLTISETLPETMQNLNASVKEMCTGLSSQRNLTVEQD